MVTLSIAWFQTEKRTVSCPMESTLAKSISEELFRLIQVNQGQMNQG